MSYVLKYNILEQNKGTLQVDIRRLKGKLVIVASYIISKIWGTLKKNSPTIKTEFLFRLLLGLNFNKPHPFI